MDERVLALLGTLNEIERELGQDVYNTAVERARIAIAAEVMVEAERRSLACRKGAPAHSSDGNLIRVDWTQKRPVGPKP